MINSVLLDTKIIIYREDNKIVDKELQQLLKVFTGSNYHLLVHFLSIEEIKRDNDLDRKRIILSKINSYQTIDNYSYIIITHF
ncbi:MAG: Pseudogene of conserved hypothetical protein [Methanobrevibacter sp. CfCl-M3]